MLYHGTSRKGVTGILKEGFRNSEKGWFGKGVYMTDCSEIALSYSFNNDMNSSYRYFFINEVLKSEKHQKFKINLKDFKDASTKPEHQYKKYTNMSSAQLTKKHYIVDYEGRKYFKTNEDNIFDEYIAEASVVIPRYLIVFKKQLINTLAEEKK